jgi:hypothetical protein
MVLISDLDAGDHDEDGERGQQRGAHQELNTMLAPD